MIPRAISIIAVLAISSAAFAQTAPSKKSKLVGREKVIPGYVVATIEGFTVVFSKESWSHKDDEAYTRPPVKVLEGELKTIVSLFRPQVVHVLRRLPIWVEWDDVRAMENGRDGSPIAIYDGNDQLGLLAEGMPPQKARTVSILRMKELTQSRQPEVDLGGCVILHELAHAVHDQLLGWENGAVSAAYKQAMARQLYNKDDYLATDELEFFAELSCAYFDQLEYFPKTRAELKKHDPVSYKLMEAVWGTAKATAKPKPAAVAPKKKAPESPRPKSSRVPVPLRDFSTEPNWHPVALLKGTTRAN